MNELLLALAGMLLGATVTLTVSRLSQAESRSMRESSADLLRLAVEHLSSTEAELRRERTMAEMTSQLEKLDVTVGNLYLTVRQSTRTHLEKPLQVGEVPPGSMPTRLARPQATLEPDGLVPEPKETPTGSSPAAHETRLRVFAEPT